MKGKNLRKKVTLLLLFLSTIRTDGYYFHVLNWLLHCHQAFSKDSYVAYRLSALLASNWLCNIFAIGLSYASNHSCSLFFVTILRFIILVNFKITLRNSTDLGLPVLILRRRTKSKAKINWFLDCFFVYEYVVGLVVLFVFDKHVKPFLFMSSNSWWGLGDLNSRL